MGSFHESWFGVPFGFTLDPGDWQSFGDIWWGGAGGLGASSQGPAYLCLSYWRTPIPSHQYTMESFGRFDGRSSAGSPYGGVAIATAADRTRHEYVAYWYYGTRGGTLEDIFYVKERTLTYGLPVPAWTIIFQEVAINAPRAFTIQIICDGNNYRVLSNGVEKTTFIEARAHSYGGIWGHSITPGANWGWNWYRASYWSAT